MIEDIGLLLLRVALGALLCYHGGTKLGLFGGRGVRGFAVGLEKMGIRPSLPFAFLAACSQAAGGVLLALGFLGPVGALLLASNMAVAVLVLLKNGFGMARGGYEYSLVLAVAFLALSLTGSGRYSVDGLLRLSLPEPWTWIVIAAVGSLGVLATVVARQRQSAPAADAGPAA